MNYETIAMVEQILKGTIYSETDWKIISGVVALAVVTFSTISGLYFYINSHINKSDIHMNQEEFVKINVCLEIQRRMDEREKRSDERHSEVQKNIEGLASDMREGFIKLERMVEKTTIRTINPVKSDKVV